MLTVRKGLVGVGIVYLVNIFIDGLHLYNFGWPDLVMHMAGGFAVGVLGVAIHQWAEKRWGVFKRPWWYHGVSLIGFVALIAVFWELHEYVIDQWIRIPRGLSLTQPSIADTMEDLFLGLLGGAAAVLLFRKRL